MAGLLTHLGIALASSMIVFLIFYKSKFKILYACSIFFGNIISDMIDFGVLGIIMRSVNPQEIMKHPWFHTLALLGHTFSNWIILTLIIVVIAFILYLFKKISKKTLFSVIICVVLFLIGVATHLKLDVLIIEKSSWV